MGPVLSSPLRLRKVPHMTGKDAVALRSEKPLYKLRCIHINTHPFFEVCSANDLFSYLYRSSVQQHKRERAHSPLSLSHFTRTGLYAAFLVAITTYFPLFMNCASKVCFYSCFIYEEMYVNLTIISNPANFTARNLLQEGKKNLFLIQWDFFSLFSMDVGRNVDIILHPKRTPVLKNVLFFCVFLS